jgi:hypothetical protein
LVMEERLSANSGVNLRSGKVTFIQFHKGAHAQTVERLSLPTCRVSEI